MDFRYEKGSETLAGRPVKGDVKTPFSQSGLPVTADHSARQHCSYGTVRIGHRILQRNVSAFLQFRKRGGNEFTVHYVINLMQLTGYMAKG